MPDKFIYLDNAATTRPDDRVIELMAGMDRDCYGNDAAVHAMGVAAAKKVERARIIVAGRLSAEPDELIFTSGGTEANIQPYWAPWRRPAERKTILSSRPLNIPA